MIESAEATTNLFGKVETWILLAGFTAGFADAAKLLF